MADYTAIDDPSAFFQTTLYTGTGSSLVVTNGGNSDLQPDLVWLKPRGITEGHFLTDSVRGVRQTIRSYRANAEETESQGLTAFSSDGFTMGTNSDINTDDEPGVAWQWKTGTAFSNDASSTSVGSIDTAGSVNTTAGFSIIGWTGTAENATLAHGLGVVPQWIIVKNRGAATSWRVYHHKNTTAPQTDHLVLDTTVATADDDSMWNDTAPTSSVFSLKTSSSVNSDGVNYIAYCFAEKQGYSKFGSYTGNDNANGPFVYLGFKPAWIMIKRTDTENTSSNMNGSHWVMLDNKRDTINTAGAAHALTANRKDAEDTSNLTNVDFLSNGFKFRGGADAVNASAAYVFMAFAENPFVTSTGIPATAR